MVDGTTITINPYDSQAGPAITKAILTANLNLNPTAQDHGILIKVPPLTLASKQIIIKKINLTTEQFLGQTRYLRKRMLTKLRSLELSSDELHHYTEQVNQLAKNTHQKIHALAQSKIIFLKK